MNYFNPPPEPEVNVELPEWYLAPRDELGEEIVVDQLIAWSDRARVTLLSLVVYSNGFDLRILGEWLEGTLDVSTHAIVQPQSEKFLRVGVEFADGRRATNMDWAYDEGGEAEDEGEDAPPEKPYMGFAHAQVLTNIGHSRIRNLWVWGLPPEGDLFVVCEWPAVGIEVTRFAVAGDRIRTVAAQSLKLWPSA